MERTRFFLHHRGDRSLCRSHNGLAMGGGLLSFGFPGFLGFSAPHPQTNNWSPRHTRQQDTCPGLQRSRSDLIFLSWPLGFSRFSLLFWPVCGGLFWGCCPLFLGFVSPHLRGPERCRGPIVLSEPAGEFSPLYFSAQVALLCWPDSALTENRRDGSHQAVVRFCQYSVLYLTNVAAGIIS